MENKNREDELFPLAEMEKNNADVHTDAPVSHRNEGQSDFPGWLYL